jgi:hypothetical protein
LLTRIGERDGDALAAVVRAVDAVCAGNVERQGVIHAGMTFQAFAE